MFYLDICNTREKREKDVKKQNTNPAMTVHDSQHQHSNGRSLLCWKRAWTTQLRTMSVGKLNLGLFIITL